MNVTFGVSLYLPALFQLSPSQSSFLLLTLALCFDFSFLILLLTQRAFLLAPWFPRTNFAALCSLVAHSSPSLFAPLNCSPPNSSVHGISQARILQWVAISYFRGIFPTQRLNLSLLHQQAGSLLLSHLGGPPIQGLCPPKTDRFLFPKSQSPG